MDQQRKMDELLHMEEIESIIHTILSAEPLREVCAEGMSTQEVKVPTTGLLPDLPEGALGLSDEEALREILQGGTPTAAHGSVFKPRVVFPGKRIDAGIRVEIASDQLSARICLTPPRGGGCDVTEESILQKLRESRVVKGVKGQYIYRLSSHPVYHRSFLIAEGMPPEDGRDGGLACHFATDQDPSEYKTAEDYRKVEFTAVRQGDMLCEIIPATLGRSGYNIFGQTIPAKDGVPLGDPLGENVCYSDDCTRIYASCEGFVCLRDGRVHVRPAKTLELMDNQELEFDGIVLVNGDVRGGSIRTAGDIIVRGTVQGAKLEAGGNIILCKGVTGKNSSIQASGSVRSYFIEQAEVAAGGDVFADVILRADVRCCGSMYLSGSRGALIGGQCTVGRNVSATSIGNDADVATQVVLNGRLQHKNEREPLVAQADDCQAALDKLSGMIGQAVRAQKTEDEKKAARFRFSHTQRCLEDELAKRKDALKRFDENGQKTSIGKITARDTLYPNVTLEIDGLYVTTKQEVRCCSAVKRGDKLAFTTASGGEATHAPI